MVHFPSVRRARRKPEAGSRKPTSSLLEHLPKHAAQHPNSFLNIPLVQARVDEEQPRLRRMTNVVRTESVDADAGIRGALTHLLDLRHLQPAQPDDDVDAGVRADDLHSIAEVLTERVEQGSAP